ncbi:MAG: penicillin-binding protein 1C [Myxococcota bacterium]
MNRRLHGAVRRTVGATGVAISAVALLVLGVAHSRSDLRVPNTTRLLVDRHGEYLGEIDAGADERLGFWPVGERVCAAEADAPDCLPPRAVAATLAIEDRRFHTHPGVDPLSVARAAQQNLQSQDRISGASTIAMQVARLQDPGPRTWSRKIVESATALLLVDRHGRDKVLATYLTVAPYGNNVHGIRYAARRYFDKPVRDLSWAETALIAGLPQAPGAMNLYTRSGRLRAETRARQILTALRSTGQLSAEEQQQALDDLARLHLPRRPIRPKSTMHQVLALDGALDGHGALMRTSLDLELQGQIQHQLRQAVDGWRSRGAEQAAAVVLDRRTMAVRAAVGSIAWDSQAGAIDYSRARRYPGSTLKPFLYARALDRGVIAPDDVLDDLERGPEGIANADHRFLGPLLPRQALANSRNVPAVNLAQRVGLDDLYTLWEELGLHEHDVPASHYGVGLAIGGMPVRLLDLTTAYATLANDGVHRPPRWTDAGPDLPGRTVLAPEHARLVARWLSDPMARLPTFPRAGWTEYPFPVAVKTGTSPDYRDSWAVGFSEDFVVGVWIGHPDWRPMQGLSGYRGGARVLAGILHALHEDQSNGLSGGELPAPEGWVSAAVCPLSGGRATPACDAALTELFPPAHLPRHDCTAHTTAGGRAVVALPARYHGWMQRTGLPLAPRAMASANHPVTVDILSPRDGMKVVRDPEVPADRATLRLEAAVDPPVEQLVWYVDGVPFAVVEPPYVARWPVRAGAHTFEARLPFRPEQSAAVVVEAR